MRKKTLCNQPLGAIVLSLQYKQNSPSPSHWGERILLYAKRKYVSKIIHCAEAKITLSSL